MDYNKNLNFNNQNHYNINYKSRFNIPKNNISQREFYYNQYDNNYQNNNFILKNSKIDINNYPTLQKYNLTIPNNKDIREKEYNKNSSSTSFENNNNYIQDIRQNTIPNSINFNYSLSNYIQRDRINNDKKFNLKTINKNNRNQIEKYNFDEINFNSENLSTSMRKNQSNNSNYFSSNTQYPKDNRRKGSRVADIIMKIYSNDILKDVIIKIYSEKIFDKLISTKVDINLIENMEKTIEEICRLEEEEVKKLDNGTIIEENLTENNNNNYKQIKLNNNNKNKSRNKDIMKVRPLSNNLRHLKINELNDEFIKKYPKTSKTILGYDKLSIDQSKSLRNSLHKSQNCSDKRKKLNKIFNNYTSNFGRYFDPSLQNGGESKLNNIVKNKMNNYYNYCQSPVKDYIENTIHNIFI